VSPASQSPPDPRAPWALQNSALVSGAPPLSAWRRSIRAGFLQPTSVHQARQPSETMVTLARPSSPTGFSQGFPFKEVVYCIGFRFDCAARHSLLSSILYPPSCPRNVQTPHTRSGRFLARRAPQQPSRLERPTKECIWAERIIGEIRQKIVEPVQNRQRFKELRHGFRNFIPAGFL
jgi:hypothetical protein